MAESQLVGCPAGPSRGGSPPASSGVLPVRRRTAEASTLQNEPRHFADHNHSHWLKYLSKTFRSSSPRKDHAAKYGNTRAPSKRPVTITPAGRRQRALRPPEPETRLRSNLWSRRWLRSRRPARSAPLSSPGPSPGSSMTRRPSRGRNIHKP